MLDLTTLPTVGPALNQRPQRRLGGRNGARPDRPRLIVLHTIESPDRSGQAALTAAWLRDSGTYGTPPNQVVVSAHVCADDQNLIRCVDDLAVAYTCGTPWNDMSLNVEMAGYARQTRDEWLDDYSTSQRGLVAQLVAAWCRKWVIPVEYLEWPDLADWENCTGITTHAQVALASQRPPLTSLGYTPGNHTDPGVNYPMDLLIAQVQAILNPGDEDIMQGWRDPRYKNVFYSTTGFLVADGEAPGLNIIVNPTGHDQKLAACCRVSFGITGPSAQSIIQASVSAGFLLPA